MAIDKSYKRNRIVIMLIGLAGMTAYMLPYLRWYYYDAYMSYFNVNDMQMGIIGSVYGTIAIIGYCAGGWVADRFSLKIIVPGSLLVTGLGGLLLLTRPGFGLHVAIYAVWGITSILTFWNPLMKCLRALVNSDEQARSYALFDMTRGLLNFLSGLAFAALFTSVVAKSAGGDEAGLKTIVVCYTVWAIIVSVVVYFALKDRLPDFSKEMKANGNADAQFAKNVIKVLKMPTTWLLIIPMFASYSVICSYSYVVPYCTSMFGMSAGLAAVMGYLAQAFRIGGCFIGGQLADRKGLSLVYGADIALMIVGVCGLLFCPKSMSFMWLLVVSIGILAMSMYSAQALHYAVMEEGSYPVETMGAATFIITPLGYAGESLMPLFNGWCLNNHEGMAGYQIMFTGFIVLCVVGLVAIILFRKICAARIKELQELRAANK